MEVIVLIVHLVVCVCLIGLVLLQRSEGGALGMGGGGGGSLMSGRGAADALAQMTSVAGGFFLVTSLGLTFLSGAASSSTGSSVFDALPRQESTPLPAAPEPVAPAAPATTPDPTESSAPQASDTRLASIMPGPAPAAAATPSAAPSSATRAGPLPASASAPRTTAPAATTPRPATTAPATKQRASTTAPAATRSTAPATSASAPATTPRPRSTTGTTQANADRPLVIPNTSGAVGGISLTDDPQGAAESIEIAPGVEAVRREHRAGPDQ